MFEPFAIGSRIARARSLPLITRGQFALVLCGVTLWACRPGGESQAQITPARGPARGDRVVVEPRAAEFFEGRVLSVNGERLKVEPITGGEPLSVSRADVYLLPAAPAVWKPGQLAICRDGSAPTGCRVERIHDDRVTVTTLVSQDERSLARTALLAASASTELNLRQAFARSRARLQFERDAARAAVPISPAGFVPTPHARVLVHRAGGWYSGVVQDLREKVAYVAFAPSFVREQVPRAELLPEPPYAGQPSRGDFVLVRPESPAEPWKTLRVLGTNDRDFRVGAPGTDERVVSVRDLVPLGGAAGAPER